MKAKFNLFCMTLLLSSLCITYTACSDDDDDNSDYATAIAGSYKGDIVSVPEGSDNSVTLVSDAVIKVTRVGDNKAKFELKESIAQIVDLDVAFESAVTLSNDKYTFSGTTTFSMGEGTDDFNATITGSIDKDGNATVNITVTEMEMTVVFTGKKQ